MSLLLDRGPAWTVTLDRPERANALSADLVERLHEVLDDAERVRPLALVLRGGPRCFCAGFDLGGLDRETDGSLAFRFLRVGMLLERLAMAPYLTVAVVEGAAVGAGADLVAACDHRLAGPGATFRFPGAGFGVVLGTSRLAALTGGPGLVGGRPVLAGSAGGLVTGHPAALADLLEGWSLTDPTARSALLAAARGTGQQQDHALAALARSLAVPGLRDRLAAHASRWTAVRAVPTQGSTDRAITDHTTEENA